MRPLTVKETQGRILDLMKEKGKRKADLFREMKELLKESDYTVQGFGANSYRKLDPEREIPFTSEEIGLIAAVLDVDSDYLLTDTPVKRKEIHDVAHFLGLSEDSVTNILAMKDSQDFRLLGLETMLNNDNGAGDLLNEYGNIAFFKTGASPLVQALSGYELKDSRSLSILLNEDEMPSAKELLFYKVSRLAQKIAEKLL